MNEPLKLFMESEMAQPKILIVYYSRTGTTRRIAESLRTLLNCDIEEITEAKSRAGAFGRARSVLEAMFKRAAAIVPTKKDPASYDLVVIGTPVWAWSISSPVRAYLEGNQSRLPATAFFCVMGGVGAASTFAQMRRLTGKSPHALCSFKERDVWSGRHRSPLDMFAKALQAAEIAG
jgi:flavodoxin